MCNVEQAERQLSRLSLFGMFQNKKNCNEGLGGLAHYLPSCSYRPIECLYYASIMPLSSKFREVRRKQRVLRSEWAIQFLVGPTNV